MIWLWWWPLLIGPWLWVLHELTQAQSKEVAECKIVREMVAEGLGEHTIIELAGHLRTKPLSHWRLFLTFGHRKWFDLSGYLLGGTVVSLLRYFLG
jgi:hypothetical protein